MPSFDQIQELMFKCSWQWTQRNGVYGRQGTGPNGNTIFLPAAGWRPNNSLSHAGSNGFYWSRELSPYGSSLVYYLDFDSDGLDTYNNYRYFGQSVRAVREL